MGTHALQLLRSAWSTFGVDRVTAITADLPSLRGITESGVRFNDAGAERILLDGGLPYYNRFQFGEGGGASIGLNWANMPSEGDLICGDLVGPAGSQRFRSWFVCNDKVKPLLDIVRNGTDLSENELGVLFASESDHFWALLRLVLFDNVTAFIDCASLSNTGDEQPGRLRDHTQFEDLKHPAFGTVYTQKNPYDNVVNWYGMRLPAAVSQYVHELSWRLETPVWWESFKSHFGDRLLDYAPHPLNQGICRACLAENPKISRFTGDPWPYLPLSWQQDE